MFIPKLLYSVDDRVNQWLTQCCREESIQSTSLDLVSFSDIITKLQLNKFVCLLPPSIRKIIKDTNGSESTKKRDLGTDSNKSSKKTKQGGTMI